MINCSECITRRLGQEREKEKIKCPFCGEEQRNDDCQYPVTYWGEDGPQEWECQECEKKFWIEERVTRTYEVGKELDKHGWIK